jgi:putative transposase
MSRYLRIRHHGATCFFTVNLFNRTDTLLVDHIDLLRTAIRFARTNRPFHIDAWVVLPDHMHCIWTLPPGDNDVSTRWRDIKSRFARMLPAVRPVSPSMARKGERGLWQRRFWERVICDDRDYAIHMDYVHINPVKHGLVGRVADWPYSTFQRCAKAGVYPLDWGGGACDIQAGERRW